METHRPDVPMTLPSLIVMTTGLLWRPATRGPIKVETGPVDNMETLMLPDPGEYQQQTSDGKHLSSSKSNIVLDKNFVRNSNLVPCRASVLDAMPCTKFYTLDDKNDH